jgi:tetratricopeptide (TPR) repeat protein
MNKENFYSLLKSPNQVGLADLPFLKETTSNFPYFQTPKLLLLKGFHLTKSLEYNEALKKTAAYVSNREILYNLLLKESLINHIEENNKAEEIKHDTIDLIEKEPISKEKVEKSKQIVDELEKQILEQAVNSTILLEVTKNIPEEPHFSEQVEKPIIEKLADTSYSFNDWLKKLNNKTFENQPKEKPISEIIDQFITTEPKISSKKQDFFSPANMAKLSIVENLDFVTETLANIYEKQGHFDKSIEAFKKLILKYPEKRTYFATRIKEIENKLKK